MALNATRFGALRRSTLSWCRSTRISACNAARDRNSPTTAHQINLQKSPITATINRFAVDRQPVWVCGRDRHWMNDRRLIDPRWIGYRPRSDRSARLTVLHARAASDCVRRAPYCRISHDRWGSDALDSEIDPCLPADRHGRARSTCRSRSLPLRSWPCPAGVVAQNPLMEAKLIRHSRRLCRCIHADASFSFPFCTIKTEREAGSQPPPFRSSFPVLLVLVHLSNSENVHKVTPVGKLLRLGSPPRCA